MTKTLTTTEELKHLASSDNTNELTRSLARECLANREVQPVGFASDSYMCELKDSGVVHAWLRRDADDPGFSVKLYTAPPAPTVPVNPTLLIDYDKEMYFLEEEVRLCALVASYLTSIGKAFQMDMTPAAPQCWLNL